MDQQINTNSNDRIGIIGLTRSGKSTFITIFSQFFGLQSQKWFIQYTGETRPQVLEMQRLIRKGKFPLPTDEVSVESAKPLNFTIQHDRRWGKSDFFEIEVRDLSGEVFDEISLTSQIVVPSPESLYDNFLNTCAGILFLIDPSKKWQTDSGGHFFIFNDILNNLQRRRTPVCIAFCITKIDELLINDPDAFKKLFEVNLTNIDQAQKEIMQFADTHVFQDNTIKKINNFSSRKNITCQWFILSSIGWLELDDKQFAQMPLGYRRAYEGKGVTIKKTGKRLLPRCYRDDSTTESIIYEPDSIQPYCVFEPLEWLFNEIKKKR